LILPSPVNRLGRHFKASRSLALLAAVAIVGLTGIATAWASGTTKVQIAQTDGARILAQQKDYTLYMFCQGAANVCTKGHSSGMWSPMIAYHRPVAGRGIKQNKLGTKKIHGHKVVTYYGQPLYRYKGDKKPHQHHGEERRQGNGMWFMVSQFGQPITKPGY
jgi:predicted lipoprotein with Yx(FWY)xxD motif